jgi:mitogen-activated protein kinase kinase 4
MFDFSASDLQDLGEIGVGNYGTVSKMVHRDSGIVMAVKVAVGCCCWHYS